MQPILPGPGPCTSPGSRPGQCEYTMILCAGSIHVHRGVIHGCVYTTKYASHLDLYSADAITLSLGM